MSDFIYLYSLKYVKGKPVRDLIADQFLKLTIAEEDKLLNITINQHIEGITTTSFLEEVKQLYYRVCFIIFSNLILKYL